MHFTKNETELVNKYYSNSSKKSNKIVILQNHIYLVESISKKIITLYNEVCSNILLDKKISDIETISIKYACLFHDVGKTIKYKFNGDDRHIENGIKIISCDEFKNDFKESTERFADTDIDRIFDYITSAIRVHKTANLNEKDYLSSFVSVVVYASDKIAHVEKKAKFKKRKRCYVKASKKIKELFQEINQKYPNDKNFELLSFCIAKILLFSVPSNNDRWTIFGDKC